MEVIFLGTGTSQGVPLIAQPPGYCNLADPRNWRTRSSIHVVIGQHHVQVDAAPEFRIQCLQNNIEQVDSFILTHGHADHILGMDDLRRFCDLLGGNALPVYSTPEGLERVKAIFPYAIREKPLVKGYPAFNLLSMPAEITLPAGRIRSSLLPHGSVDVLGLVFEENNGGRFAYFTDCATVTPAAIELAEGADVVVLDGLRYIPHPSHMNIDQALEMAERIGGKKTFLIHMTCNIDHAELSPRLPADVFLSYDGLRCSI